MFLKFSLLFIFCCVALASTDGQIFSPKDVENGLISEGVTEPGAHEITEFLFKERPDDVTAGELKIEFQKFLASLSEGDKAAVRQIINKELDKFFEGNEESVSILLN
ncbi:DUF148 domain-containing protein [Caenorhabditis elegans]|uniref:DUF148 domain-containing protein n=1 Tax=Caenorhabditis elegans TaxID=6239 RepID=Q95XV5_CAEEL|nr:DUF148 domain-containing protein [Caenorhabditis elegans]CCD69749.2 DUF148 domain-containing protein [Caenorhabditis elegans]|eukprot:NP_001346709.1 Uncharacterized protein CELE_Y57E12AL.4 [Caenorhabditis elegans]